MQGGRQLQGFSPPGGRRPLRVPLSDVHLEADGDDLLLVFTLPPGAYATVALAKIMKSGP